MQANSAVKFDKKLDVRRKILIAAYCINEAKKADNINELYANVRQYLTRDSDKELFS